MNPILFGDSNAPLFGALHEPSPSRAREHGVVICPPIAQEHVRTHWALRQLALALERAGFHCLRFDWYGVGDSSGELPKATLARWEADVASAAQELRDASGVRRVSLVGLRFGGLLAARAAKKLRPSSLVLWDPVLDGRAYLDELRNVHEGALADKKRYWADAKRRRAPAELIGFDLGDALLHEIDGANVPSGDELSGVRVCLVDSGGSRALSSFADALRKGGVDVDLRATGLAAKWNDPGQIEELLLPADAAQRVGEFLEGRAA